MIIINIWYVLFIDCTLGFCEKKVDIPIVNILINIEYHLPYFMGYKPRFVHLMYFCCFSFKL